MFVREFRNEDGPILDHVAASAFSEYSCHFENWTQYHDDWSRMSALSDLGTILVAERDGEIAGGVCYVRPDTPRLPWFENEWAIIRSLVVDPKYRGRGIGRKLTEECISLAEQDGCVTIALTSSPVMAAAVGIYRSMGFKETRVVGTKDGFTWYLYCLDLHNRLSERKS